MKYIIRILLCSVAALAVVCCGGRKARKEAAAAAEKARLDSIAQAEMILKQKQAEITMAAL